MEEAVEEGLIRSIGVSNYGNHHLEELLNTNPMIKPVINQIDLHPFMTRNDMVEFNKKNHVALEAWAPLVRGEKFDHPKIVELSRKHKKSPAQILLRWSLQRGFIPLPKSVKKERIVSNTQIYDFELSEQEVQELNSLDEYLVTDWDPTKAP